MEETDIAANVVNATGQWSKIVTDSLGAVWVKIAAFVPGFIGAIVILLVGYVVGRIVRFIVTKLLSSIGIDSVGDKIAETFGAEEFEAKPSAIIGQIMFWLIMLTFIIAASNSMGMTSVSETINSLILFLPNVIAAMIIAIIGIIVADFVKTLVETGAASAGLDFGPPLAKIAQFAIIVLVGMVALGQLGIDTVLMRRVIEIFLMAAGAALAISLGFGSKATASAIVSGMYARDIFQPGDSIKVDDVEGVVVAVTAVSTTIEKSDGIQVHIPNEKLMSMTAETKPGADT